MLKGKLKNSTLKMQLLRKKKKLQKKQNGIVLIQFASTQGLRRVWFLL